MYQGSLGTIYFIIHFTVQSATDLGIQYPGNLGTIGYESYSMYSRLKAYVPRYDVDRSTRC